MLWSLQEHHPGGDSRDEQDYGHQIYLDLDTEGLLGRRRRRRHLGWEEITGCFGLLLLLRSLLLRGCGWSRVLVGGRVGDGFAIALEWEKACVMENSNVIHFGNRKNELSNTFDDINLTVFTVLCPQYCNWLDKKQPRPWDMSLSHLLVNNDKGLKLTPLLLWLVDMSFSLIFSFKFLAASFSSSWSCPRTSLYLDPPDAAPLWRSSSVLPPPPPPPASLTPLLEDDFLLFGDWPCFFRCFNSVSGIIMVEDVSTTF